MTTLSVVFTVVVLAFLGTNAQVNYRCTVTPNSWKGDAYFIDYDTRYVRFSEIYYNRLTQSIYELVRKRESDGERIDYEEWYDFRTETKTNRTFGGECRSYTISRPFVPFGVDRDARFEGVSTFGGSLTVDAFSGDFSDGAGYYYVFWAPIPGSYTTCIPVVESYIREGPSTPFQDRRNIHITYTNFTTTFENPPPPCTAVNINRGNMV